MIAVLVLAASSALPTVEIASGVRMPAVSIGTWKSASGLDAFDITKKWLANGYRGIDTALIYFDQQMSAVSMPR